MCFNVSRTFLDLSWGLNDTISITWFWYFVFWIFAQYIVFYPHCVDEIIKKKSRTKQTWNSLTTMANKFLILMEKVPKKQTCLRFTKSFNGFLDMKNRECVCPKKKIKITFIFMNLLDINGIILGSLINSSYLPFRQF